jgi:hypothetical protein
MALLDRIFGGKKRTTLDVSRVAKETEEQPAARSEREMVYREASVVYESGYKRKGVVLDHNATGVRIRFPTNERLPERVTLYAKAVGLEGHARVVWQKGSEAGLTLE